MSRDKPTFFCTDCAAFVQMQLDGQHTFNHESAEGYDVTVRLSFGHCVRCSHPGLIAEESGSTFDGPWTDAGQLYPPRLDIPQFELPRKVKRSLEEALRCHAAGANLATAVMVRRTLEAVGQEFDSNVRSLNQGLAVMKQKGVISEEFESWGHELRFLGNVGAHPSDVLPSRQEATDALTFLNAIVETIYHLRPKFQEIVAKRHKEKA